MTEERPLMVLTDEEVADMPYLEELLDALLGANPPEPESAVTLVPSPPRCAHPKPSRILHPDRWECARCGHLVFLAKARKGRQHRNYGNRAELSAARTYGGEKVGHHGGPVDFRGEEWATQMKTHRRLPPKEWRDAFAAMSATTGRLPRLLVRYVLPTGPVDFFVVKGPDWLDWFGKDEPDE